MELGRLGEALDAFDRALQCDLNDEGTWASRGQCLHGLGRYDEAARCFDRVARTSPARAQHLRDVAAARRASAPSRTPSEADESARWEATYDARKRLFEQHFGPFPDDVSKLANLTGVWPGGCLVQMAAPKLGGLWVSASFGLSNSDMPTSVTLEAHSARATASGREYASQLGKRTPRPVPAGLAGYGYELLVLTRTKEFWPLMFLNTAVQHELLRDADFLDRVTDVGGVTMNDVRVGDREHADFVVTKAAPPLPASLVLPNGTAHLLVARWITRAELDFAFQQGQRALVERLLASRNGLVS
jgi:tetratricopeptide (TPR) repeat protein